MYQEAIVPLEFLVGQSPESINYWMQLAQAYQKTNQLNKAEDAYKKLIQLDPDNKNGIEMLDKLKTLNKPKNAK